MHILKFQVTLIEGREKCEIKLTKPLKFKTGRKDCISDDPEGRAYVTTKKEVLIEIVLKHFKIRISLGFFPYRIHQN